MKYYYQNGNNFRIEKEPLSEIPEGYKQITEEEYEQAQEELLEFCRNLKTPIQEMKERISKLRGLLDSSDYYQHKLIDGAITKEQYEPIRLQRQEWRDEINRIEEEIENEQ